MNTIFCSADEAYVLADMALCNYQKYFLKPNAYMDISCILSISLYILYVYPLYILPLPLLENNILKGPKHEHFGSEFLIQSK